LHPIPRAHWLGHWLAGIDGRDCAESVLDYAGDIEAQVLTLAGPITGPWRLLRPLFSLAGRRLEQRVWEQTKAYVDTIGTRAATIK
jgi:hypothetical protein